MKRRSFLTVFLLLVSLILPAETVFVSMLEQAPDGELHNFEASSAWESGVLDALFDMGVIVSNTPIQSISTFDKNEALQLAREGGADTVIVLELHYPMIPEAKSKKRAVPDRIQFSIYSVSSRQLMKQVTFTPSTPSENTEQDMQMAKQQTQLLYKK